MRDRRVWIVIGVAFAVLVAMLAWSAFGSDETAAPSPSLPASPGGSGSPSPSASGSPSGPAPSPTGSASPGTTPSASASASQKPTPNPTSSLAEDGLPLVTIERPTRGSSVGIPVEINGTAVAFEAKLRYEILDSKGKLFTNGPAYASAGAPERGLWQVEVELPIGSYTLVAFVESPKDGKRLSEARVKFRAG